MKRLWKDYNLSIVLGAMFLVAWIGQFVFGWFEFASEQQAHGEVATFLGQSGYVWRFGESTMENWQSEFLQLLTFVVLTSFLIHRGSHESRDTDDEMKAQLDRIEERLNRLDGGPGSGKPTLRRSV